jgi:phosphate transport system substrate-binding protein
MRTFKHRSRGWLLLGMAALAVSSLALAACGDDDDDDDDTTATATSANGTTAAATTPAEGGIDYGELSGTIDIDGSSTVFPISQAVAEDFNEVAGDVRITVGFSGTGGGFEKFCRGEIQVSDASRPIKDSEVETCAGDGIEDIVELQVAIDALTVVVNPDNDWATCMTAEQLHMAFVDGGAAKWSDIDPSWPDEDIVFYYPGADSGTFDYFVEAIIEGSAPEGVEEPSHRSDGTSSEDDNVLVGGVEGDQYSIGYFGFAYYLGEGSGLKAVEVDGGDGCVAPTFDAALAGDYTPLSRPLFIYTTESLLSEREEVLGFIKFYLDNTNAISEEVGYISLPDDLLAAQQAKVEPFLP